MFSNTGKRLQGMLLILMFLSLLPDSVLSTDDPPDSITIDRLSELYQPVVFDHAMHLESYDCTTCHHHTTGDVTDNPACSRCHPSPGSKMKVGCYHCHLSGYCIDGKTKPVGYHIDIPGLKGALHLQCLGCHNKEGGPVGCTDCHAFTPPGEKRYQVRE